MKTRIRTRLLVPAAAVALALTGCATDADDTDTDPPVSDSAPTSPADDADAGDHTITVSATGDGPIGLTTADVPASDAEDRAGRLIVGPGGCFAFSEQDQPQILVFEAGAEFVLHDDRPSVTTESGTFYVGDSSTFVVSEVAKDDVDGIPTRCERGTADTVLVALRA